MATVIPSPYDSNTIDQSVEPLRFLLAGLGASRTLRVESAWSTAVVMARSLAEQRRGLRGRPNLRFQSRAVAFDRNEAMALQMTLARLGLRRTLAPLFSDESPVTGSLTAGASSITCTTDYRRFFDGQRIVVYNRPLGVGVLPSYEVIAIDTAGSGSLSLDGTLAGSYTAPVYVAPLVECEVLLEAGGAYRIGNQYQYDLTLIERIGPMAMPSLATGGATPSGWSEFESLPIFDPMRHMTSDGDTGWRREGELVALGLGFTPELYGDRPRATFDMPLEFLTREDAWSYLELAHSRMGRLYPFMLVSPSENFTVESTGTITSSIDLTAVGPVGDWTLYRPYLAIVEHDETVTVLDLDGATIERNGSTDTVTFAEALSPGIAASDIERVAVCRKVRYAMDVTEENWLTPDVMRSSMEASELLEEKDITIADLSELATVGLAVPYQAGACSGSGALNCEEDCPDALTLPFLDTLTSQIVFTVDPDDFTFPGAALTAPDGTEAWDGRVFRWGVSDEWQVYYLGSNPEVEPVLSFGGKLLSYRTGIYWIPPADRPALISGCSYAGDGACWELRLYLQGSSGDILLWKGGIDGSCPDAGAIACGETGGGEGGSSGPGGISGGGGGGDGPAPCECPNGLLTTYYITDGPVTVGDDTIDGGCINIPNAEDGKPEWDGSLVLNPGVDCRWDGGIEQYPENWKGRGISYANIQLNTDLCRWELWLVYEDDGVAGPFEWIGYKTTGDTPEGVYTASTTTSCGGLQPATLTVSSSP